MKTDTVLRVVLVAWTAWGCAARRSPTIVTRDDAQAAAALCAKYPIGETENVRIVPVERVTGGSAYLVQVRRGETPHRHLAHDLVVTVLAGQGVLTIGDAQRPLRAGDVAIVPRGVPHWFTNTGDRPSVTFAVFVPPLDAPDSVPVDRVDSAPTAR